MTIVDRKYRIIEKEGYYSVQWQNRLRWKLCGPLFSSSGDAEKWIEARRKKEWRVVKEL